MRLGVELLLGTGPEEAGFCQRMAMEPADADAE